MIRVLDLKFNVIKAATQRLGYGSSRYSSKLSEARPQNPIVSSGTKQSNAQAEGRKPVTVSFGNAGDQSVEAKATELIGHSALSKVIDRSSEQTREIEPEVAVGETCREKIKSQ